jgi:hypothetical protein
MIGPFDGLVWLHEEKERRTVNCDDHAGMGWSRTNDEIPSKLAYFIER